MTQCDAWAQHPLPQKVYVPREVPDGWHRHFMLHSNQTTTDTLVMLWTFLERNNRITVTKLTIENMTINVEIQDYTVPLPGESCQPRITAITHRYGILQSHHLPAKHA